MLSGFRYTKPKTEDEDAATDLSDISGNEDWFEYITDENGNKVWNKDSAKNVGLYKRIADVTAYLMDPEAGKKKYRLHANYSPEHMSAMQELYNQNKDVWDSRIAEIKARVESGNAKPEDIAFLKNFFIVEPSENIAARQKQAAIDAEKKRFSDSGFDYDTWSPYIT